MINYIRVNFLLFNFQPSSRPEQTIFHVHNYRLDCQTSLSDPRAQIRPPHQPGNPSRNQTITSEFHSKPVHPAGQQIRPAPCTATPNHQIRSAPPDHRPPSSTIQLLISTAHPVYWNGTGQVHSLWVGSRGVYRALDEPCKAYFPHTFGLKFPDFFRLNLIVVRLASGLPRLVRASPSLFH